MATFAARQWRAQPRPCCAAGFTPSQSGWIVEPHFRQSDLAGVAEAGAGPGIGFAVGAVAVACRARAVFGDDGALVVGDEIAAVGCAGALIPDQRLVHAGAMHVAAERGG